MNTGSAHNRWILWLTLFIGLLLQITPLSASIFFIKPNWVLLILIYWLIALPHRISIGSAFFMGTVIDLFSGSILGVHAFAFSLIGYLATFKFQLIRNLALWQQVLIIMVLSMCYDFCLFILDIIINHAVTITSTSLFSNVVNGLLWPSLFLLLRYIRRHFQIR